MRGLMMDYPLTITHLVERAQRLFPAKEIVTRTSSGRHRYTYADLADRVGRLGNALRRLGVQPGQRVGTFAWNSYRHLELFLGVPSYGAVLHTLNIRLFPEQITFIANHAEDQVLFVDDVLLAQLEPLAASLKTIKAYVVMGDGPLPETSLAPLYRYEDLLAAESPGFAFPRLDEQAAAGMCYTSGTTGNPKGVAYSHRSLVLQSFAQCMTDAFGLGEADVILSVVPMFHANAWGLPFSGTMVGATQIYPGAQPTPRDIAQLIHDFKVTVAGGVPTVMLGILGVLEQEPFDLSSLRAAPCGGSAVPESLIGKFDDLGATIVQAWGMTETSPLATLSRPRPHMHAWPADQRRAVRARQGRPMPFVDIRVADEQGNALPWDGKSIGELQVRGPWIIGAYHDDERSKDAFVDGWFKTGDVATIDPEGYMQITDRAKDVIKSGGEWVSSVDLENAIMGHPDVLEAAVIGLPHPKWQERPLACVVAKPGRTVTEAQILDFLKDKVVKWALPGAVAFVDAIPKTSVGKFAKRELRDRFATFEWP